MDQLDVNFLILADKAEAIGGKLYMMGGAWTRLHLPQIPGRPGESFSIAIGVDVPWNLTNREFALTLELTDADNATVGDALTAQLEQGRPPGLRAGTPQLLVIAISAQPEFPDEGRYCFHVAIDGERKASTPFEVVPFPQVLQPQEG